MALPSRAKAAQYKKALPIGAFLFLFQSSILTWIVFSRALGADTFHALLDFVTIAGTTFLYSRNWVCEVAFKKSERRWLFVGVWSLGLGGVMVGGEALHHLLFGQTSGVPPAWPILVAALVGAVGNWWMHNILDSVDDAEHDHLHKNNLDHVISDAALSLTVFISGCSMWYFQSMAIDSMIAVLVGLIVLPYFAIKRWRGATLGLQHGHHH